MRKTFTWHDARRKRKKMQGITDQFIFNGNLDNATSSHSSFFKKYWGPIQYRVKCLIVRSRGACQISKQYEHLTPDLAPSRIAISHDMISYALMIPLPDLRYLTSYTIMIPPQPQPSTSHPNPNPPPTHHHHHHLHHLSGEKWNTSVSDVSEYSRRFGLAKSLACGKCISSQVIVRL